MNNYFEQKEHALELEPVFKPTEIRKFYLEGDGVVDINGHSYKANSSFTSKIANEIGISPTSVRDLEKNLTKTDVNTILNKCFTKYFFHNRPIRANLIGDRSTAILTSYSKGDIIPFSTIFRGIDRVQEKFNEISISISERDLHIILNESERVEIPNLDLEAFIPNLALVYSYGHSLHIEKMIERIACTNQMTIPLMKNSEKDLTSLNSSSSIVKAIKKMEINTVNEEYIQKIVNISNVNASLNEYEIISKLLASYLKEKDSTLINTLLKKDEINKLINEGGSLYKGNAKSKSRMEVPIKYWDLINAVTDFASHDYNNQLSSKDREWLKLKGFKMLSSTPDILKYNLN